MTRRLVLAGGLVVAAVLAVLATVAIVRVQGAPDGALARAAEVSPAASQRLSFTDWAAVREQLGADLDTASSGTQVERFLERAYRADLASTSAMVASARATQDALGLSPGTVEWEGFSQSTSGAVVSLRLGDGDALDALADRLSGSGFTAPSDDDGTWVGGADLLAGIDPSISPVFGYAVLLDDEQLALFSDNPDYLEEARATARGDEPGMIEEVADVVEPIPDALSAAVYTGEYACGELAMTTADANDQAEGDRLLEAAGAVDPITAFAMARTPDGMRTALGFETSDAARDNADPRAALASGPAPGQGGSFGTRFALSSVVADGRAVVLEMQPRRDQLVVSDLSTGPLLFATC